MKAEKKVVPTRYGSAFILVRGGEVLLVRRPPRGLLGGMMMPPSSAWTDEKSEALDGAPGAFDWKSAGEVRHVFTHFALRLDVWTAEAGSKAKIEGEWLTHEDALAGTPTVGRKALALVLKATARRR